jgi:dolichol-phosphate mannosyltransferase
MFINVISKVIKMEKLSIIVPCYNEEKGIGHLHNQLVPVLNTLQEAWNLELIFVDDGSVDNTHQLLHEKFSSLEYVKIIKHEVNMNLGGAMRTGFSHATGDVIVTMDSDCTYHPQQIPELLSHLDEDTDIVAASPYHPMGKVENVPSYRLLLSKGICQIYRTLTGSDIHTFTALFRAQKRHIIDNVPFESNNFLATAETLIYAMNKGYKVKEYPTTLSVRQYGVSKMRLFGVIKSHLSFVFKLTKEKVGLKK